MAKREIESDKSLIKEVFTKWYRIPEYQRPYIWGSDQINDLLDDISYAATHNPDNEYFLGSIVYQHKKANTLENRKYDENDLLDGQQRLTTLFLIMGVIRDISDNSGLKESCQKFIYQKEDKYEKIPEIVRILFKIRPDVEEFIDKYVKEEGGTSKIEELKKLSETEDDISIKNMANAIIKIRDYFSKSDLDNFYTFLLNNVILIYVASEDLQDAFRLFTILNDRGVKLRNSDILKAQNLQELSSDEERTKWAKFWEEIEEYFGEDFDRFLSWIRTILVKEKARLSLLKEFEDNIYFPKEKDKSTGQIKPILLNKGLATFKLLQTYSDHYNKIFYSNGNNYSLNSSWAFDNLLVIMDTGFPATDWVPPLLAYYNKYKENNLLEFLIKLDNKFSADWIAQYSPTDRIENMNNIIKAIDVHDNTSVLLTDLVFEIDSDSLFRNLEGNIYGRKFAKYILLKLNHIYHDHHVTRITGYSEISVEHILPQNPEDNSQWCQDFNLDQRYGLTHKLGNLILLGRRKNTSLGRLKYEDKKLKYFHDSINIFPYSLKVINKNNKWTPDELLQNQVSMINKLKEYYQ